MFERDIESYFDGVLENIDIILDNGFYKDEDKEGLKYVKLKIKDWYNLLGTGGVYPLALAT